MKLEKCNMTKHYNNNRYLWNDLKFINQSYCLERDRHLEVNNMFGSSNYTGIEYINVKIQQIKQTVFRKMK